MKTDNQGSDHQKGEEMVSRWLAKYNQNIGLENILRESLKALAKEIEWLRKTVGQHQYDVAMKIVNEMKIFPAGFSLTELYEGINRIELAIQLNPENQQIIEDEISALKSILDIIPARFFSNDS